MTAPAPVPALVGMTFDAVADHVSTAAAYADAAASFAQVRDPRGVAYAIRCAGMALAAAADTAKALQPVAGNGGAA